MMTLIKYALHPVILLCVIGAWLMNPESPALYLVVLLCVQLLLGTLEYWIPARQMWVVHAKEKITGILIVLVLIICSISVAMLYVAFLSEPLAQLRETLHLDFWPHDWPLVIQLFMAFILSEFIWYGIHRAEHRWHIVWRVSGHGAHHSTSQTRATSPSRSVAAGSLRLQYVALAFAGRAKARSS